MKWCTAIHTPPGHSTWQCMRRRGHHGLHKDDRYRRWGIVHRWGSS